MVWYIITNVEFMAFALRERVHEVHDVTELPFGGAEWYRGEERYARLGSISRGLGGGA